MPPNRTAQRTSSRWWQLRKRTMRDDFTINTKDILAKRVGYRCSNPTCQKPTTGPQSDPNKIINVGVACHITAASKGGLRFDERITREERKSSENGIWLCQTCAKFIDDDPKRFHVLDLKFWKENAENDALSSIIDENFRLRKELQVLVDVVEGRDSYGLIQVMGLLCGDEFCYQFVIGNMGNKPLYDVIINIYDPEEYAKTLKNEIATVEGVKLHQRINVGNLPPNLHTAIFEPMKFPEKGYSHYVSYIGTRSGIYYQEIFCYPSIKPNQGWRIATKLQKRNFETNQYELKYHNIDKSMNEIGLNWHLK